MWCEFNRSIDFLYRRGSEEEREERLHAVATRSHPTTRVMSPCCSPTHDTPPLLSTWHAWLPWTPFRILPLQCKQKKGTGSVERDKISTGPRLVHWRRSETTLKPSILGPHRLFGSPFASILTRRRFPFIKHTKPQRKFERRKYPSSNFLSQVHTFLHYLY